MMRRTRRAWPPEARFIAILERSFQALGVVGRGGFGGAGPAGHGPAGRKLRTRPLNRSASGQAAAKAMRTRVAISVMRAAILIRRMRRVVNWAVASGCGLGMASRTVSNTQ